MKALDGIMANMSTYQTSISALNEANVTLQTRNDELKTASNTMTTQVSKLTTKVANLEASKSPSPTSPNTESRGKRWKKYCYTCGSNYQNSSRNCPIATPRHKPPNTKH